MWTLRFLNGPKAGKTEVLNKHSLTLGRATGCDIHVSSANISKEHLRIEVFDDKLLITDSGSRNGTFVNGVQIKTSKVLSGDKVAIHDIFFEIQKVPDKWANQYNQPGSQAQFQPPPQHQSPQSYGNLAYQAQPDQQPETQEALPPTPKGEALRVFVNGKIPQWVGLFQEYMDRVVLPGLYRLPEVFEFKWVLAGFMAAFILLVTTLSTVPLIRILKASLEEESQQHAITIATTLARVNIPALQQGLDSALSVEIATSRPGVKKAFILNNTDGNIMSPSSQAGTYPELPYIHEGRKRDRDSVKQIDDSTIVAMVPVRVFRPETASQSVVAWSVVYYDMASLAVDNSQVLSLFITTLFISMILGLGLFYILFKIIEYPIRSLNVQLDLALKEGHETVQCNYQFPELQTLTSNVSSALSRAMNQDIAASGAPGKVIEHDRNREMTNLVELMGFAAMAIRADDLSISAVNQAFEARAGVASAHLNSSSIHDLPDQALRLSVKDLVERVEHNPDDIASNSLEFSGVTFQIVGFAVFGSTKIAYFLIVLLPQEGGG